MGTVTLTVMLTGVVEVGWTTTSGVSAQVALAMSTLQETATLCWNDPAAVTWKLAGDDVVPRGIVKVAG